MTDQPQPAAAPSPEATAADVLGMAALTICQPYADLCLLPDEHPEHKRAENRKWFSFYRGPLLIHAGKNRNWLEEDDGNPGHDVYGLKLDGVVFGAIVGVVEMVACVTADDIRRGRLPAELMWLKTHQHVEGPYCHIYANPLRFKRPIPCKGALGHFKVTERNLLSSGGRHG